MAGHPMVLAQHHSRHHQSIAIRCCKDCPNFKIRLCPPELLDFGEKKATRQSGRQAAAGTTGEPCPPGRPQVPRRWETRMGRHSQGATTTRSPQGADGECAPNGNSVTTTAIPWTCPHRRHTGHGRGDRDLPGHRTQETVTSRDTQDTQAGH